MYEACGAFEASQPRIQKQCVLRRLTACTWRPRTPQPGAQRRRAKRVRGPVYSGGRARLSVHTHSCGRGKRTKSRGRHVVGLGLVTQRRRRQRRKARCTGKTGAGHQGGLGHRSSGGSRWAHTCRQGKTANAAASAARLPRQEVVGHGVRAQPPAARAADEPARIWRALAHGRTKGPFWARASPRR